MHCWLHLGLEAKTAGHNPLQQWYITWGWLLKARRHGPRGFLTRSWLPNLSSFPDGRSIGRLPSQATMNSLEFIPRWPDFQRYPDPTAAGGCQWDRQRRGSSLRSALAVRAVGERNIPHENASNTQRQPRCCSPARHCAVGTEESHGIH